MVPPDRPSRRRVLASASAGLGALVGCLGNRGSDDSGGDSDDNDGGERRERTDTPTTTTAASPPDPPDSVDGAWPLDGFDATGRGANPAAVGPDGGADPLWERTVADGGRLRGPVVADGRAVVAAGLNVVALDAASGERRWVTRIDALETSMTDAGVRAVAVVDDAVLASVASDAGGPSLHALDAASGEHRWSTSAGLRVVAADGTAYTAGDERVHATGLDGTDRWAVRPEETDDTLSGPVTDGERVVVSADRVSAVDAADGSVQWRARAGTHPESPVVVDDTVYTGGFYGSVVAQRATDGSERWRYDAEGAPIGSVTVAADADGRVGPVVAETNGTQGAAVVHAIDAADGTGLWRKSRGRVVAGGRGVVYHVDGTVLTALTAGTGSERWTTTLDFEPRSVSVVDRFLLASGVDGAVRLLG